MLVKLTRRGAAPRGNSDIYVNPSHVRYVIDEPGSENSRYSAVVFESEPKLAINGTASEIVDALNKGLLEQSTA
jgi:hypothetical protein